MGRLVERRQAVVYRELQSVITTLSRSKLAMVPRGAIGRLRRAQIAISLVADLTSTVDAVLLLIRVADEDIVNPSNDLVERLKPLWAHKVAHVFEAGATDTANVVLPASSENIQLVFDGDKHRGEEIKNQGVSSNVEHGWSIAHYSTTGTTTFLWYFISLEWEMEYIENSTPSANIRWDNDEEQNQL